MTQMQRSPWKVWQDAKTKVMGSRDIQSLHVSGSVKDIYSSDSMEDSPSVSESPTMTTDPKDSFATVQVGFDAISHQMDTSLVPQIPKASCGKKGTSHGTKTVRLTDQLVPSGSVTGPVKSTLPKHSRRQSWSAISDPPTTGQQWPAEWDIPSNLPARETDANCTIGKMSARDSREACVEGIKTMNISNESASLLALQQLKRKRKEGLFHFPANDASRAPNALENMKVIAQDESARRAMSMDGTSRSKVGHILLPEYSDVTRLYLFGEELGKGASGVVRYCVDRSVWRELACKSISKTCLRNQLDVDDLRSEVRTMKMMRGHPVVVRLEAVHEDSKSVHLVMEHCKGGDMFTRIKHMKRFTEEEAAVNCRKIASVLAFSHERGIMHRDLKPENILMASEETNTDIRVTDFGSATFFRPGQPLNQLVGSPLYMAPSVLRHSYGPEADMWSLGIILYVMLCGFPPFWGDSNAEIFRSIQFDELDMERGPWRYIAREAKDLVRLLLTRDDKSRMTAHEVKSHPWIMKYCSTSASPRQTLFDWKDMASPSTRRQINLTSCHAAVGQSAETYEYRRRSLSTYDVVSDIAAFSGGANGALVAAEAFKLYKSVLTRSPTPYRQASLDEGDEEEEEEEELEVVEMVELEAAALRQKTEGPASLVSNSTGKPLPVHLGHLSPKPPLTPSPGKDGDGKVSKWRMIRKRLTRHRVSDSNR